VNSRKQISLPSVIDVLKPAVGPSSSHTLGPMRAGLLFRRQLERRPDPRPGDRISVTLYGSLAHTGKGHLTDLAVVAGLAGCSPEDIAQRSMQSIYGEISSTGVLLLPSYGIVFQPGADIVFDTETPPEHHPNTLRFALHDHRGLVELSVSYLSIGGGTVVDASHLAALQNRRESNPVEARDIVDACQRHGETLVDYALAMEESIHGRSKDRVADHLQKTWTLMSRSIHSGLHCSGVLPGPLGVERRAAAMLKQFEKQQGTPGIISSDTTRASVYAIAVAEENAGGGAVVTAPTCGSAGVLPACLRVMQESLDLTDEQIGDALLVAGIVGELAIAKASIAGALVGCQGEIGVASAMAAAAVCHLLGGSVADQIDRAAETALEHYLGLTCDPVAGLVQIPCIERNAAGAVSALNAANMAMISGGRDRVSFDATLEVMHQTGLDMRSRYKETSLGGLAAIIDLDRDGVPDIQTPS